ncbi:MAG: hypothetical protein IT430_00660 [Phycisphaerales bacterium]|nr:hypothetical protein [Phycisphaerales bacterium]
MNRLRLLMVAALAATLLCTAGFRSSAHESGIERRNGIDEAHYKIARQLIERSIAYLRTQQDEATGGWALPEEGKPHLPGISALVLTGMLMEPDIDESDPGVRRGLDYILSFRQEDGGIYDRILSNYNTSLALSALAQVGRPDAAAAIKPAQDFVRSIQCDGQTGPDGNAIDPSHPYYGGAGYTTDSRPDNSNLATMLQGLHDSGLDCNDPAFQRAVVFLQRTQMSDELNDMPYADGSTQGGFIYSTSPNNQSVGAGESKAGMIEETMDDGTQVSRLRCYGSMTYSGFKSYLYANLDHDDPRVVTAFEWLKQHYTLDENPGMGMQGYYYYLVTMSRSLDAWGSTTITPLKPDGTPGEPRDWANDLIDKLASLQRPDGSFVNEAERWMEGDPVLATSYALLALRHAID